VALALAPAAQAAQRYVSTTGEGEACTQPALDPGSCRLTGATGSTSRTSGFKIVR